MTVEFDLRYASTNTKQASTNTRPEGVKNPVVVGKEKDIDSIINELSELNLIEYSSFMNESISSKWKFCKFLDVEFYVYEMNTPIELNR